MASSAPLSKANTAFSLALFNKLSDNDKTANIFYSPFSISAALAMVMLGSRGNTAKQMSEVLCFTKAETAPHAGAQQKVQMHQHVQLPQQVQSRKTPLPKVATKPTY